MKEEPDSEKKYLNIYSGKITCFDKKDNSKIYLENGKYPLMYKNGRLGAKFINGAREALEKYDALFWEYDKTKSKSQLKGNIKRIFNEDAFSAIDVKPKNNEKIKSASLIDDFKEKGEKNSSLQVSHYLAPKICFKI